MEVFRLLYYGTALLKGHEKLGPSTLNPKPSGFQSSDLGLRVEALGFRFRLRTCRVCHWGLEFKAYHRGLNNWNRVFLGVCYTIIIIRKLQNNSITPCNTLCSLRTHARRHERVKTLESDAVPHQ